jgi:hypothetical protein
MLSGMFKIMVCGISGEILKTVQKMSEQKGQNASRIDVYRKLSEEMFE